MFCPKCGKQLPDNVKFCTGCGAQIGQVKENGQKKEAKNSKPERLPEPVRTNIPSTHQTDFPSQIEMSQKTKESENKNKRTMIILFGVLIVLILVAIGMAVFYFKEINNSGRDESVQNELDNGDDEETEEQEPEDDAKAQDDEAQDAEAQDVEEQDADDTDSSVAESEPEEEARVVSDTNEVVRNTILSGVPKALYSYEFEETLGNAQVVVRNADETMPEVTSDIEPQYISGMDGKAVYLDGSYGVQLSDVKRIGTSYTIAFWMKADELYAWAPYIHIGYDLLDSSRRSRIWLGQKEDGVSIAPILSSERAVSKESFEIRPKDYAVNTIEPGIWSHIVFTVDGNTRGSRNSSQLGTIYVSGRYAGEGDVVLDTMNVDDFTVYLGINCWDVLYPVAFDDVKIWDQVLDDQQVLELFNAYQ